MFDSIFSTDSKDSAMGSIFDKKDSETESSLFSMSSSDSSSEKTQQMSSLFGQSQQEETSKTPKLSIFDQSPIDNALEETKSTVKQSIYEQSTQNKTQGALSAGTSNAQGSKSQTREEINSNYNVFGSDSDNSFSKDALNAGEDNMSMQKQEYVPNKTESIYDSRNDTKDSNNLAGTAGGSVMAELNMRERNEGNLSITDRMRGIEGKRLDNSGEISLADQYNDKALDKRALGGAYNITLIDTYKDKRLWKAVHGLNYDSIVTNEEEGTDSQFKGKKKSAKEETVKQKGPVDLTKTIDFSKNSWDKDSDAKNEDTDNCSDDSCDSKIIGGSAGLVDTEFGKEKSRETKTDKDSLLKKSKIVGVDKNSIVDYSKIANEPIEILTGNDKGGTKRVRLNEQLYIKAKEINLKYGKDIITTEELEIMENGGETPNLLLSYKELSDKRKKLTELLNSPDTKNVDKKICIDKINKIKPIMFKKAIEGE